MSDLSGALLIVGLAVFAGAGGGLLLAVRRRPAAAPVTPPPAPAASPAPPASPVATQLQELAYGTARQPASGDPQVRSPCCRV